MAQGTAGPTTSMRLLVALQEVDTHLSSFARAVPHVGVLALAGLPSACQPWTRSAITRRGSAWRVREHRTAAGRRVVVHCCNHRASSAPSKDAGEGPVRTRLRGAAHFAGKDMHLGSTWRKMVDCSMCVLRAERGRFCRLRCTSSGFQ